MARHTFHRWTCGMPLRAAWRPVGVFMILLVALPRAAVFGANVSGLLEKMLATGAKNTPPAVATAKSQFEGLKRARPKDSRVDYAYGLVLVAQHRYRDALPILDGYIQNNPADLAARRTRLWAYVQDRQMRAALAEACDVTTLLSEDGFDQPDAQVKATLHLLGQLFAFFEQTGSKSADAKHLVEAKNAVLEKLDENLLKVFDEGRATITVRFDQLRAEQAARQRQAATENQEQDLKKHQAIEADRLKVATEEEKISSNSEQVQDAQRELAVLQQQFASLTNDRSRLTAQITVVQTQITQMAADHGITVNLMPPGDLRAPVVSTSRQIDPTRLIALRSLATNIAVLNRQAFELDRRMLSLQSRAGELTAAGAQGAQQIARSEAVADKAEKRARALEKQVARSKATPSPRAGTLTAKMSSFATYVPLPYEQEKKRVLGWFKKDAQ